MNRAILTGAVIAAALAAQPAAAQYWVASNGTVNANCSYAVPCSDFQTAHDVATAGNVISCIDSGNFGTSIVISKSITIDCTGTESASVTVGLGGENALAVDGTGIVVNLRGLTFDPGANTGAIGVWLIHGSVLRIEHCRISGFRSTTGIGLFVEPLSGTGSVYVRDTVIADNGLVSSGGGVIVRPVNNASARVVLDHVTVTGNTYGVFADGTSGTGTISLHVRDSAVSGSLFNGISAYTAAGKGVASVVVDHSTSANNAGDGIMAQSASAFVVLGHATVLANGTGLHSVGGGSILSYQTNFASGNLGGNDGAPTGTLPVQ